ncbi:MAG: hypothetical protein Q4C83_02685 [Candidatus Saccharibacteria bacterium]|nr:hypothetical protein [Candidatus Saccharibacteria bacterium]
MSDKINPFEAPESAPAVGSAQPAQSAQPAFVTPASAPSNLPPAPQPAAPTMPSTAPQPIMNTSAAPTKIKKSHKNLIIGLVTGGIAIIIAVVALVLFLSWSKVTADDYDEAYDKLGDVYSVIRDDIDVDTDDLDDVDELFGEINSTLDEAQTNVDELGKMKAISRDEKAKSLFDKFNQNYGEFKTKMKSFMDDVKAIWPVTQEVQKMADISSYDDDYYSQLAASYNKIAEVAGKAEPKNDDLKDAMADIKEAASTYAGYYTKRVAGESVSYSSEVSKASSKFSSATSKLSSAMSNSAIYDAVSDVSDSYSKLASYLSKQQSKLEADEYEDDYYNF